MLELAKQMSHATKYDFKYGEGYTLNDYTADGTIFDFMAGVRKVKWSVAHSENREHFSDVNMVLCCKVTL